MYEKFTWGDNGATDEEHMKELKLFILALKVANTELVMQYEEKYYKQLQGLAMGVADAPDLANLYGWHFEQKCDILNHPQVPFYGRYIDDCLALVYAYSENEAIRIASLVEFDGCTIEWSASPHYQVFLDMTIYVDKDGMLQHMPYRKSRSHQERIPWTSYHPLDVKRGTFIGEMSRLATLCSLRSHYITAIKGLVALYIKRGYPQELVEKWTSDNMSNRWNRRLSEPTQPREAVPDEVLVLKSTFNSAWDYFNAKELGNTVLGYWREWISRAQRNDFNAEFPKFRRDLHALKGFDEETYGTLVHVFAGTGVMPDIEKTGILNRRMLVSRKRTRNLFDLTSFWKKTVIATLEQDIRTGGNPAMEIDDDGDIQLHRHSSPKQDFSYLLQ
jgi:hypothetical protein